MDWQGELLVLMWSKPGAQYIVSLEEPLFWPSIPVGIELVGYAAYDPRPCSVGTTVRLRDSRGLPYDDSYLPCDVRSWDSTIGADGLAFHCPHLENPLLRSCAPFGSDGTAWINLVSDYPAGSTCGDTQPQMGFILGRLVLL